MQLPVRLPPCSWQFPCSVEEQERAAGTGELVGLGADLSPSTLVAAYSCGIFPMPAGNRLAWWAPDPRGVLPLDGLVVSRSLRRSCQRYRVSVDTAFGEVLAACADPSRPGGWITRQVQAAYMGLHRLGLAHSVEVFSDGEQLVGGLYGVALGGLFAGESMFHLARDASKVALVALVEGLAGGGGSLLDVQWATPHLSSLGVVEVSRRRYHELLAEALERPQLSLGV